MINKFKNILYVLAFVLITSCSNVNKLTVIETKKCLVIGDDIETVTKCISQLTEYSERNISKNNRIEIPLHRITERCFESKTDCSNNKLIGQLNVVNKKINIKNDGLSELSNSGLNVVITPTVLYYSKSGGAGGSFIMLYIFYSQKDRKVIGWVNLGSKKLPI